MPKTPIQKAKRADVLAKKKQDLRKSVNKQISNSSLCEKLLENNICLATALLKRERNCQSLVTRNAELTTRIVQLTEENQQLHLVSDTRNTAVANILDNTKKIQDYVTNTISMCEEFLACNTTVRLSSASAGSK
ncbi:uncharacterized protein [Temnothorax nylanderi]|uniref:uncharacterized protein n=1 Tax=Temnothorax nylanderi TaxID=102681 RepID=UPI003A8A63C0